jgi:hypothetical protein
LAIGSQLSAWKCSEGRITISVTRQNRCRVPLWPGISGSRPPDRAISIAIAPEIACLAPESWAVHRAEWTQPARQAVAASLARPRPAGVLALRPAGPPREFRLFRSIAAVFRSNSVDSTPMRTREVIETNRSSFRHNAEHDSDAAENPNDDGPQPPDRLCPGCLIAPPGSSPLCFFPFARELTFCRFRVVSAVRAWAAAARWFPDGGTRNVSERGHWAAAGISR